MSTIFTDRGQMSTSSHGRSDTVHDFVAFATACGQVGQILLVRVQDLEGWGTHSPVHAMGDGLRTDLEDVYTAQHRRLHSLAWMIVGSKEAADDVVQECFTRFASLRSPETIDKPAAYLKRMVINECQATIRHRTRVHVTDRPSDRSHVDGSDLETLDALRSLSPRRRLAIVLRYFEDLPVAEIAVLMTCKPSTVSSLLHRGLADLKGVLR